MEVPFKTMIYLPIHIDRDSNYDYRCEEPTVFNSTLSLRGVVKLQVSFSVCRRNITVQYEKNTAKWKCICARREFLNSAATHRQADTCGA